MPDKQRKARVTWTQHEETLLAVEVHRMRTGEASRLWPNNKEATSLVAQLTLAMRVLEPARRKSANAVYNRGSYYDETWYATALARNELYTPKPKQAEPTPPTAESTEPAKEREVEAPQETDPELEALLVMGSLMQTLIGYLGNAITKGVKQALVELRNEEERRMREDGNLTAPPPPVATSAREIVRRKIDVIGLQAVQKRIVESSPVARNWDIRFLQSGQEHHRADLRERVIICTKFVSHNQQQRYRQMKADIHWANGGAMSVIKELERLARRAPEGRMH